MTQFPRHAMTGITLLLALGAAALAGAAAAQARYPVEMVRYEDAGSGMWISHPKDWRREFPGEPTRVLLGEPVGAGAGGAFILCSVELTTPPQRLRVSQARLDRDLVEGFRTRAWPQELAGKRTVIDHQVREIGGVPVGAIEWESSEARAGRPASARGIRLVRTTPTALWTAECAALGFSRQAAEAHFTQNLRLIGDILGSIQFSP